jgi:hypothetical protein
LGSSDDPTDFADLKTSAEKLGSNTSTEKPSSVSAEFDLLSDLDVLGAAGGIPKHAYTHPARQEAEREEHEDREHSATANR